jgi:hypothetical protein
VLSFSGFAINAISPMSPSMKTIMTRLPRVYQTMLELQMLDITKEPI